ncbi:phage major capsid protein [Bradyrhizobium sp. Gha]|uniref:phage major capsid protein n=1 Tax=Bradyrhizobium sp. Gha TaxID=1855318 RepID=UPI0008E0084D|nr:phage major capsid protein [Bradyrhizobium sp. Gha]SFJ25595.1 phage major capsid protein, HK97 family [Bradyrhizobium sp. Gha]
MAKLHELQERRAHAVSEMQSINDKVETETRDYSDAEDKRHKELKSEIAGLDRQIARAVDLQEATRAAPAILHHGRGDGSFEERAREYSLIRAIAHQSGMAVDAGREIEISQELQRRFGMTPEGMLAPTQIFERRVVTTAAPAAGPGSNIIATDLLAGQFIDILRDALATARLGARVLSNLVGNVSIPRLKASATGEWVAENSGLTASDVQLDQVSLSPKHVGALVEVSRNMLQQSTPDVETIIRDDFAALLARAIDKGALIGGGSNEPVGVLSTSGIGDVPGGAAGLAPTWANICALVSAVAGANALTGSLGFVTNTKVVGKCTSVLKSTADTSSNFILENPGAVQLAGFPLVQTNLIPSNLVKGGSGTVCSALVFGNWRDLLIGYWSAFDVLVNPYESTAYTKGNVQVRAMATCDVAVRQVKSFAATKDVLTT